MAGISGTADTMMLGILIALLVIVLLYVMLLRYKMNRLSRNYMMFMRGANGQTLENKLGTEVRRLREMTEKISETVAEQKTCPVCKTAHYKMSVLSNIRPFRTAVSGKVFR